VTVRVGSLFGFETEGGGGVVGALISVNTISRRWDKLIAVTTCPPENLYIFYRAGNNRFTVFNPTAEDDGGFTEFFEDQSTVVDNGDDTWTITLLPNGGWWQKDFIVKFVAGTEMEIA